MLNTIIIEDERLARENLLQSLFRISQDINVIAVISSVKEGIANLGKYDKVDIIFSDVQLPDGLSFEIFQRTEAQAPVIFITGFDEFMMNAFESNGIDYLLKPVDEKELEKALKKYKMFQTHFASKGSGLNNLLNDYSSARKRTRIVVKKGQEHIALPLEDIALFYTENKIVYVLDHSGKKYLVDKNLSELEHELDDTAFFRANRQYIINVKYVKGFKAYEKVKLMVDMSLPELQDRCNIIISQETAPDFRKWIYEA